MTDDVARELIHKVNNLLAVIYAQGSAARAAGTLEAFDKALSFIEQSAESTRGFVRRAAAQQQQ